MSKYSDKTYDSYESFLEEALSDTSGPLDWGNPEVLELVRELGRDQFGHYPDPAGLHDLLTGHPVFGGFYEGATVNPQQYGDIDISTALSNFPADYGEALSEDWQGFTDVVSSPLETTRNMWNLMKGYTRRGKGFAERNKENIEAADMMTEEMKQQFSPSGLQHRPARALATASGVTPARGPLGYLSSLAKAGRAPALVGTVANQAQRVLNYADPLSGVVQGAGDAYRMGRAGTQAIRDMTGRADPGKKTGMERVFGRRDPDMPGWITEKFGQTLSMIGNVPNRAISELISRSREPVSWKPMSLDRSTPFHERVGGSEVETTTAGLLVDKLLDLHAADRGTRYAWVLHEAVDKIQERASDSYAAQLKKFEPELAQQVDFGVVEMLRAGVEDRLRDVFGLKVDYIQPRAWPKEYDKHKRPYKDEPSPKYDRMEIDWESSQLSGELREKRGTVQKILNIVNNIGVDEWGKYTPPTVKDLYVLRRDLDEIISTTYSITDETPTQAKKVMYAFRDEVAQALEMSIGQVTGKQWNQVMSEYADHILFLERAQEHLGVSPRSFVKRGDENIQLQQGIETATLKRQGAQEGPIGSKDLNQKQLQVLRELESRSGDSSILPNLQAMVNSPVMSGGLVGRSAAIGGVVGAGATAFDGVERAGPELISNMIIGAITMSMGQAIISPRIVARAVSRSQVLQDWFRKNGKRFEVWTSDQASAEELEKVAMLLRAGSRDAADAGRVANVLETMIGEEGSASEKKWGKEKRDSVMRSLHKAVQNKRDQTGHTSQYGIF